MFNSKLKRKIKELEEGRLEGIKARAKIIEILEIQQQRVEVLEARLADKGYL